MKNPAKACLTAGLFFLTLLSLNAQPMDYGPVLRVRIIQEADSVKLLFNKTWSIQATGINLTRADSVYIIKVRNGAVTVFNNKQVVYSNDSSLTFGSSQGTVTVFDVPYGTGWWWAGKEDRLYEGIMRIQKTPEGKTDVIMHLPLEQYLKGVIPYEIGSDSPLQALKAQAVAARSEAVVALKSELYSGPYHDLTADVECQVFAGNHKRTPVSDQAVDETAGLILTEKGQPIHAYYASNCGGHSERIENIWPEREAHQTYRQALSDNTTRLPRDLSHEDSIAQWIASYPDVFCNPYLHSALPDWSQKNFRWKKTESVESISQRLGRGKNTGRLLDIIALQRGPSGRIYNARFIFQKDSFDVQGELNIRQQWQPALRSSCFIMEKTDSTFILSGAGWGHGVGMCQSGAIAQAVQGKNYIEILQHYYPLAKVSSMAINTKMKTPE